MNYLSIAPAFYPRCLMPTSTHFFPVVFLYAKFSCLMLLSLPVFRDGPLENLWRRWRGVAVEVQKKYSRKGKSNEKNSCTLKIKILKDIHAMASQNSYKEFLRLENPPPSPPPIIFLMVRPLRPQLHVICHHLLPGLL